VAADLSSWGVPVIKALRLAPGDDLEAISETVDRFLAAATRSTCRVLVDARVPGAHGGTGKRLDLEFVRALTARRPVVVAGGLKPENVAQVAALGAGVLGVDVASGVERPDGRKDAARVASFIQAARHR
jgi:phosphoribosylanthranilate isomerase